jgi:hypothetical protein
MQKLLFQYDPKELNLELLVTLQSALVAKLLLVNRELSSRCQKLVALSDRMPNVEDEREKLRKSADWCDKINVILEDYLIERRTVSVTQPPKTKHHEKKND